MIDKVKPQKTKENQLLTGALRCSFPHLFEKYYFQGQDKGEYSLQLLIPKDDPTARMLADMVKKAMVEKFNGKIPNGWWNPLQDGDDKADKYPEMAGHWVIKVSDKNNQPLVVDQKKQEIMDARDIYAGCYVRVKLDVYAFNNVQKGAGFGLRLVQKIADAESFGRAPERAEELPDLELPETSGDDPFAGFEG